MKRCTYLFCLLFTTTVSAEPFTYQGQLSDGGTLVNGDYDFVFKLYDGSDPNTATLQGSAMVVDDLPVSDGVFTATIDPGILFDGTPLWLEVSVRPGNSTGGYMQLLPLQPITAAPEAQVSLSVVADAIGSLEISNGSITTADLADGSVTSDKLANASVGNSQLAADAVDSGKIADGSISTADLANSSVTTAKLANNSVTGNKLASGSVGNSQLAADAVDSGKIADGTVANVDLAGGIDPAKITGTAWTANNDGSGSGLDADRLDGQDSTTFWQTGGNSPAAGAYLGTTNTEPLEFRVNGKRVGVITDAESTYTDASFTDWITHAPNVLLGSENNVIDPSVAGATIGGGGGTDPAITTCGDGTQPCVNTVLAGFGTVSGGWGNYASGGRSTVGGGYSNTASGTSATVGGGDFNTASGTSATVGGGYSNTASGTSATVGGGRVNSASGSESRIGGGMFNTANGNNSTIGGGFDNKADGNEATIGGGQANTVSGNRATIGGGWTNTASGNYSTIGGGWTNTASGFAATVPGGSSNQAGGSISFAAGYRAKVRDAATSGDTNGDEGTFIWADFTDADFTSTGPNQFLVRASGGIWFGTTSSPSITAGQFINTSTGGYLSTGGTWINSSDRNRKTNFQPIDPQAVLEKVVSLPILRWNYKEEDENTLHLGPMAQDFHAAFGLGADDKHIATVDADGVALAAIQALAQENRSLKGQLAQLEDNHRQQQQQLAILLADREAQQQQLAQLQQALEALQANQQQLLTRLRQAEGEANTQEPAQ